MLRVTRTDQQHHSPSLRTQYETTALGTQLSCSKCLQAVAYVTYMRMTSIQQREEMQKKKKNNVSPFHKLLTLEKFHTTINKNKNKKLNK